MNETKLNDILTRASQLINNEKFNYIVEGKAKNITIGENGNVVQNNNIINENFYNEIQDLNVKNTKKVVFPKKF